ncbi:hypothetical protein [Pseudomonas vancouverensis]|uniref:DUF4175 domain-containing protein n=1 Tax=Pseudomonas vancouverensis TaxID=95300 RepID=A0A1H2PG03_PSEVA|nr:hypothetical protein [Pseudomonas vancouverensis]KAB0497473.1 hypothetical protein F7R09_08095 [Pseudomonas vancouverensis]TDB66200.1 hypothetical protein EIY72_04865 [Pseudomonas vancouverensis]SDV16630.1 hypothetical protein SAMN05216558_5564 [Pseudomonas vancouverensis]
MKPRQTNFWKVFGVPTAIAVLSAGGLFAALLGDGVWDSLSWVGLGIPAFLALRGLLLRR